MESPLGQTGGSLFEEAELFASLPAMDTSASVESYEELT